MAETRRNSALNYTPPSYKEAEERRDRSTSQYDSLIVPSGPKFFKARKNNNTIRILPPTWEGAKHYAYEVKVHSDVGVQNQQYLCLVQNEMSPYKECPLCEERNRPDVSHEDREKLRAKSRNYIYLINRYETDQGPLLWSISTQSDKEILAQSLIKRTQEYLPIAHPYKGYDVDFVRDGEGLATRYRGFQVSRESTPISTNENELRRWVSYIDDHPIPEILQFFSPDHILNVFTGHSDTSRSSRERDEDRPSPRSRRDERDERDERGDNGRPPWEEDERSNGTGEQRSELRRRLRNE